MFSAELISLARETLASLRSRKLKLCTAESCTGGLIAAVLTEIAGSSDVVERGFVVYSNEAKTEMLGVPENVLTLHGAVSEACARAMAEGALRRSPADIAISVTGIAGPGGGSPDKPVGLVHLAVAARSRATIHRRALYAGESRGEVRRKSVIAALDLIRAQLETDTRLA